MGTDDILFPPKKPSSQVLDAAENLLEFRYEFEVFLLLCAKEFAVQAMPSSFLLAADGTVLAKHSGFRTADAPDYERTIQEALAKARAAN